MSCLSVRSRFVAIFVLCAFKVTEGAPPNPCYNHAPLDDPKYLKSNTLLGPNSGLLVHGWYRITSPTNGIFMPTCPTANECGTASQVWTNVTVPPYSGRETVLKLCVKRRDNCCAYQRSIRVKNCGNYIVYHLTPLPQSEGYCFTQPSYASTMKPTAATPTSPSLQQTSTSSGNPHTITSRPTEVTTNDPSKSDFPEWVIIAGHIAAVGTFLLCCSCCCCCCCSCKCRN